MKTMTINEVVDYLNNSDDHDDFAMRGDNFIPTENFNNSFYHGDEAEEFEYDGVSAINIPAYGYSYVENSANLARRYGKNVFLLKGTLVNADEEYHDPEEVLVQNNEIIAIITMEE